MVINSQEPERAFSALLPDDVTATESKQGGAITGINGGVANGTLSVLNQSTNALNPAAINFHLELQRVNDLVKCKCLFLI